MSIKQISVFVENRPGHLQRILALFTEKDINVRGYNATLQLLLRMLSVWY